MSCLTKDRAGQRNIKLMSMVPIAARKEGGGDRTLPVAMVGWRKSCRVGPKVAALPSTRRRRRRLELLMPAQRQRARCRACFTTVFATRVSDCTVGDRALLCQLWLGALRLPRVANTPQRRRPPTTPPLRARLAANQRATDCL